MSLLKLFFGGLVAACLQLSIVVTAGLLTLGSSGPTLGDAVDGSAALSFLEGQCRFLRWVVLASAVAVALARSFCVDDSAEQIRRVARSLSPADPRNVTWALVMQFLLAAIGCAILIFEAPPLLLVMFCYHFYGAPFAAWIVWSGTMSVGAAFFGASAHAAAQGLH